MERQAHFSGGYVPLTDGEREPALHSQMYISTTSLSHANIYVCTYLSDILNVFV